MTHLKLKGFHKKNPVVCGIECWPTFSQRKCFGENTNTDSNSCKFAKVHNAAVYTGNIRHHTVLC